jgi:hypothetical protein
LFIVRASWIESPLKFDIGLVEHSYAGQVQLINLILFFIQVYWASLFLLPGQVIKNMEQIMKSFLWSGSDMRNIGAKMAWDQVCLPKKEGGLGIKRIT